MEALLAQMPRPIAARQRGLTLVEVLVSFTVFSVVSIGISQLVVLALSINNQSRHRAIATALAADRLHQFTAAPISPPDSHALYKLPEEIISEGPSPSFTADYGTLPSHLDFKRVLTIAYDTPTPGMHRAECRVLWRTPPQGEQSLSIVLYLHPHLEEQR